jgi:hypothetical protein
MMREMRCLRIVLVFIVLVVLVSCTRQAPRLPSPDATSTKPVPPAPVVTDYDSFMERLDVAGLGVAREGQRRTEFLGRFLGVPGRAVMIEGEPIAAYQFPTERALSVMRSTISPRGDTVGSAIISWDAPRFYSAGRLLVVYFGDDARTLDTLRSVLGPKFAGG